MKPDPRFCELSKSFWANIRSISERVGYTVRGKDAVRVPSIEEIVEAYGAIGLSSEHLADGSLSLTKFGERILDYFQYRADALNGTVRDLLMDVDGARATFQNLKAELSPKCPLPMNKQKKEKRDFAFFTGIINMLIEKHAGGHGCDYDPGKLTTVTRDEAPLRTLARRVDGAFPSTVNPIAIWEIKEYYYTTTFGSRVADGVYESLLDGMELEELREHEQVDIQHLLMVDARYTWWVKGKSYLCRIIDMLHMGYVDEVLFGREVLDRLPKIVNEWVAELGEDQPG